MFVEFKKDCISANERLLSKEMVKLETQPIEGPYELWCQNSHHYDSKPVIVEEDHLFEKGDIPINSVSEIEKTSGEKPKPEREVCSYCGKTFLFVGQHIKSMHSKKFSNTKKFTCGLCFENFSER